jgi:multicomponent Na+:H+ antiporter subunit A
MLVTIVAIAALAGLAPWLCRVAGRAALPLMALLPAGLTVWLLLRLGTVATEGRVVEATPWAPNVGLWLSFSLDGLSLLFALLISGIGALIVLYTGGYLAGDPRLGRFTAFLFAFMASMLGVVLADNLLLLYVFWELTSLTSFLLIGFEHEKAEARAAAWQALLVTGAGGLCLLAGLVLLGMTAGAYELSALLAAGDRVAASPAAPAIVALVLLGAFTKSAQVPFHFWLPNAMAAPTPVSAYLHSATMVKAGVYLIARLTPVLGGVPGWSEVVTAIGALTMLVGATLALAQTDLKRILAYSTVSVLGTLTMLLGVGTPLAAKAAVSYLLAHALYKAALFLVAGTLDHETGTRDVTRLGGLARVMPITATAAVLAGASMAGLPPFLGFLGKETLIDAVVGGANGAVVVTVLVASTFLVAVAGMVALTPFLGQRRPTPKVAHEGVASLWLGPIVLAVLGLATGSVPALVASPLLAPAASAALGQPVPVDLKLWHGFTLVLALSGVVLGGGALLFWQQARLRALLARGEPLARVGPGRWYDEAVAGLNAVALWQTRLLQNGYLRRYLIVIMLTAVLLSGTALLGRGALPQPNFLIPDERLFMVGVLGLIVAASVATTIAQSRLAAVASLGVAGFGIALVYVLFGAPDLAMTQILVDILTVVLFILVFYHLPRLPRPARLGSRLRDAAVATAAGALVTVLIWAANTGPHPGTLSSYYSENSYDAGRGRNIVNVILVDFRAFDTLGEIVVLGVAAFGVYALLKLRVREGHE